MNHERNIVDDVKERIDIVDLVGRYVRLKKAGKNYSGLCPFHSEKTPSFIVSPDIQRYKCFGCGKSGDIITFVQEVETLEFLDALEKLAKEANIPFKRGERSDSFAELYKINSEAAQFFQAELKRDAGAYQYIKDRGLAEQGSEQFIIGYSPGFNAFINRVEGKYKKEVLVKTGLFTEKNGKLNDRFIKRIMFPIFTPSGKIAGFTGRSLPGDDYGPKYLNTPDTPIFHKKDLLFGLYQAKSAIKKEDLCIICEGSTDVISTSLRGVDNIVAPLGTGLTIEQLGQIRKYSEKILFMFDSDDAGKKALERAFIMSSSLGLTTFASNSEPYKDIDELAQKEPDRLKDVVKPKLDTYSYLFTMKLESVDLSTLSGKNEAERYHRMLTSEISEETTRQFYIKKFQKLTRIKITDLKKPSASARTPVQTTVDRDQNIPITITNENRQEYFFISLIFKSNLIGKLASIDERYFHDGQIRDLILFCKKNSISKLSELRNSELLDSELGKTIEILIFGQDSYPVTADPHETLNEIYLKIQIDYLRREVDQLRKFLAIAEERDDNTLARGISEKITDITSRINRLNERIGRL